MVAESVETPRGRLAVSLRLDEARRKRGFKSWAEVARRGGIRPTPLSHLVTGRVRLSDVRLGTLVKLCAALEVSLDELVSVDAADEAPRPRGDRPITGEEFASAVKQLLASPPPADWVGPTEDDLAEVTSISVSTLGKRLRRDRARLQKLGDTE